LEVHTRSHVSLPFCDRLPRRIRNTFGHTSPQRLTDKRTATAVWQGTLKEGNGTIATQSKVLNDTPSSFRSRFGDGVETNPEQLIAAAHAG
jgi:hypothetical protein